MRRKPKRRTLIALAVLTAALLAAAAAWDGRSGSSAAAADQSHFTVALFGDMPYNALGKAEYPDVIADINSSNAVFSIFDGDLKAGGDGACTDSLYTTALSSFSLFRKPVIVVPGDNDWTDCWGRYGPGTGGFDPIERLNHERQLFYSTGKSLGRKPMALTRESEEGGQYAQYVENVRWTWGPVVFVGLDFQGSNDNLPHAGVDGETRDAAEIARMTAEHNAREAANEHWLDESFAYAKSIGAKGVLVDWQSDPDFNNEYKLDPLSYDGLTALVAKLRADTIAFGGQVALVHGDGHYFKLDKPLNSPSGKVLANFTRVETFGATNDHWVAGIVDTKDPNLFEFEPRMVAANVG